MLGVEHDNMSVTIVGGAIGVAGYFIDRSRESYRIRNLHLAAESELERMVEPISHPLNIFSTPLLAAIDTQNHDDRNNI